MDAAAPNTGRTLDPVLRVLEAIATADEAPRIEDLASRIAVHRSDRVSDRAHTRAPHADLRRDSGGRCHPGDKLAQWARANRTALEIVARPELTALADDLSMTAFVVVRYGNEAGHARQRRTAADHRSRRLPAWVSSSDRSRSAGLAILAGQAALPTSDPRSPRHGGAAGRTRQARSYPGWPPWRRGSPTPITVSPRSPASSWRASRST